jgi:hypothetical protein
LRLAEDTILLIRYAFITLARLSSSDTTLHYAERQAFFDRPRHYASHELMPLFFITAIEPCRQPLADEYIVSHYYADIFSDYASFRFRRDERRHYAFRQHCHDTPPIDDILPY